MTEPVKIEKLPKGLQEVLFGLDRRLKSSIPGDSLFVIYISYAKIHD